MAKGDITDLSMEMRNYENQGESLIDGGGHSWRTLLRSLSVKDRQPHAKHVSTKGEDEYYHKHN